MNTTDPILIDALIAADYLEEHANFPEAARHARRGRTSLIIHETTL